MVYVNGHPTAISESTAATILLVILFFYVLPSLYNFWQLFAKARRPGWAVLIPFYGPIVAAQIGKKPLWIAVLFGITSFVQFSSDTDAAYVIASLQTIILLVTGLLLLAGMSKQYKTNRRFWIAIVVFPLAASRVMDLVKYGPKKVPNKTK